jgi:hypothetical protein
MNRKDPTLKPTKPYQSFFTRFRAALAELDRSAWENMINTCITPVTSAIPAVVSPTPFHVDKSCVHLKNSMAPYRRAHDQNKVTCFITRERRSVVDPPSSLQQHNCWRFAQGNTLKLKVCPNIPRWHSRDTSLMFLSPKIWPDQTPPLSTQLKIGSPGYFKLIPALPRSGSYDSLLTQNGFLTLHDHC